MLRLTTGGKGGVAGTRRPCARQRQQQLRSRSSPAWQTAASALPSPHSAALEPSSQARGRQQQDKGTAGARAPASAAAAAATASAFELATTSSPAIGRRQRLGSSSPPPSPRSPRLSSSPQQQHLPAWLGSAVRRAVLSLDEAPLLVVKVGSSGEEDLSSWDPSRSSSSSSSSSQASSASTSSSSPSSASASPEFVTHALPRAALSAPALWPAIAATVVAPEGKEPEALLLVHKIEEEEEEEEGGEEAAAVSSSSRSPSSSPRRRHHHHHLRLSDFAALERGGIATAELAGRVGDCCHGEGGGAAESGEAESGAGTDDDDNDESGFADGDLRALISPRRSSSPSLHSETHWGSSASPSSSADVAFYGVVVQTAKAKSQQQQHRAPSSFSSSFDADEASSSASGCFVLKTVRVRPSSPGGCSCIYFSLTRVGRAGEPLAEQLKRSWLA